MDNDPDFDEDLKLSKKLNETQRFLPLKCFVLKILKAKIRVRCSRQKPFRYITPKLMAE